MNHFKIASKIGCWFCLTFHETEKIWITWISESSEPEFNSKTHFNQLFLQSLVERWLSEACSRISIRKDFSSNFEERPGKCLPEFIWQITFDKRYFFKTPTTKLYTALDNFKFNHFFYCYCTKTDPYQFSLNKTLCGNY